MKAYNSVEVIKSEFPELANCVTEEQKAHGLFRIVQDLSTYTKHQLFQNNEAELEHCFRIAQQILEHGSNISKLAIENVFVYSISSALEVSFSVSPKARTQFLKFFRKEYCKIINASCA